MNTMIEFKVDTLTSCQHDIPSPNTAFLANCWFSHNKQQLAKVRVYLPKDSGPVKEIIESDLLLTSSPNLSPEKIEMSPFFITNFLTDLSSIPSNFKIEISREDLHSNESPNIGTSQESALALVRSVHYPTDFDYTDTFGEFFNTPILLAVDQIIAIPLSLIDRVTLEQLQFISHNKNDNQFIFVRVLSAKVPFNQHQSLFYIDSDTTRLTQERTIDGPIYNPCLLSSLDFTQKIDEAITFLTFYMKMLQIKGCDSISRPFLHFKGPHGCGKSMMTLSIANRLGFNLHFVNCHELCAGTTAAVEEKMKNAQKYCQPYNPLIIYLKNLDLLLLKAKDELDERLVESLSNSIKNIISAGNKSFLLVASTLKDLPFCLRKLVTKEMTLSFGTENERTILIKEILEKNYSTSPLDMPDNVLHYLVTFTESMLKSDIELLLKKLFEHSRNGEMGWKICEETIDEVLRNFHKFHEGSGPIQPIQKVNWNDIGGLSNVIDEVIQITKLAIKGDSLLPKGANVLRNNGLIFYGPPGTGKTLLAKGVATECSINFLSVKGPELVNMYVGKSEENVRHLFQQARNAAPCVLFFDELDSLAPRRGISGDSGGVMDRLVSQLATEIDAVNNQTDCSGLVLIGATNRPDLIDPALMRPGRFDQMFYIGGCYDREAKLDVLGSITRHFPFDQERTSTSKAFLETLVDNLPEKITGADLYAICANALQKAFHRIIASDPGSADTQSLKIKSKDFQSAASSVQLSVSNNEFKNYEQIKNYYTVPSIAQS